MIEAVNAEKLEFEAFALNELCQFTGAFCNSLHCDEMGYLCRTTYWGDAEMEERMERVRKRTLEIEEQQEQQYLCGKSGCALCALPPGYSESEGCVGGSGGESKRRKRDREIYRSIE